MLGIEAERFSRDVIESFIENTMNRDFSSLRSWDCPSYQFKDEWERSLDYLLEARSEFAEHEGKQMANK